MTLPTTPTRPARWQAFPVKIATLWRQAFPGLVLGALLGRVSTWWQGEPFSLPNNLPLMGIAAAMVMLAYFCQPTLARDTGLRAMGPWGFRRFVAWDQIVQVSFGRLYLIQPSLKLVDAQGRSHWIARDTKNLRELHALASRFGGPAHPLTVALETPLHAL